MALLTVAAACGGEEPTSTPTPSPTPTPTATPTPVPTPTPIPAAFFVQEAGRAFQDVGSVRFAIDHQVGSMSIVGIELKKISGELARPDQLQATLSGTASGFFVRVEVRLLGEDAYIRDPITRQWEKLSTATSPLAFFDPVAGVSSILQGLSQVTRLPDEQIEGVPVLRLQGTVPAEALQPFVGSNTLAATVQIDVWVGRDDLLLRRAVIRGAVLDTDDPGTIRQLDLSDFNLPVQVTPPE